jgi:hypothetical protein
VIVNALISFITALSSFAGAGGVVFSFLHFFASNTFCIFLYSSSLETLSKASHKLLPTRNFMDVLRKHRNEREFITCFLNTSLYLLRICVPGACEHICCSCAFDFFKFPLEVVTSKEYKVGNNQAILSRAACRS